VQREGVFFHIILRDDWLSGDLRRDFFRCAINSFWQRSYCFPHRAGEITSVSDECRLVAAVHCAGVGHVAKHHARIDDEVFVNPKTPAIAMSLCRDDLRTRRGASGFPLGSTGWNGRECSEDGADDHISHKKGSESVRENMVGTVSEW
jgi:hypothetical protein